MLEQDFNLNSKIVITFGLKLVLWCLGYIDNQLEAVTLVTQPMLQHRPNSMELRSMDSYTQILCKFQKCKRRVPPPPLLYNDFEKSFFFSKILTNVFFSSMKIL